MTAVLMEGIGTDKGQKEWTVKESTLEKQLNRKRKVGGL